MSDEHPNGTLLVPVANVETVDRLMDTAIDVAGDQSLGVTVIHVVEVPAQIPLSEGSRLVDDEDQVLVKHAERKGKDAGIPVDTRIRLARDVATGIVGAAREHEANTILLGWRGRPPRKNIILGSYVDRVLQKAPCDVLVKRIRTDTEAIDSVLVPVASGAHTELAAKTAASIARRHDARVLLLHVLPSDPSDSDRASGSELLRNARAQFDGVSEVAVELGESDHVSGAITDASENFAVTVLGVTEQSLLRRKLLGTVSEGVGRHAEGTVILARRHLSKTSRLRQLIDVIVQ